MYASSTSIVKDYVQYNHFDDGCSYNVIWNSDTTSSSVLLKNININRGVVGTSSSYNMINIDVLNSEQEINVNKEEKNNEIYTTNNIQLKEAEDITTEETEVLEEAKEPEEGSVFLINTYQEPKQLLIYQYLQLFDY